MERDASSAFSLRPDRFVMKKLSRNEYILKNSCTFATQTKLVSHGLNNR